MNDRIEQLTVLLKQLNEGAAIEQVASDFKGLLGQITAQELAEAENMLVERGSLVADIQRASTLHTDLVVDNIQKETLNRVDQLAGHPARVFRGENEGIRLFIANQLTPNLNMYLKTQEEKARQDLLFDAKDLYGIVKHYERKENLLFPYLEQKGITAPPQVMWGVDNIIRELIRLFVEAIEEKPVLPKRVKLIADRLLPQIEGMIVKENEILLPMLMNHMTEEDWILAAQESRVIGTVFNQGVAGAANSDAATWLKEKTEGVLQDSPTAADKINLPSGHLSIEQLTAMLNTLPTDLTFVDRDEIVRYYSEGKHPVFTRTRTIIGRDLFLCHPPQLVPTIQKLIQDFKAGTKDSETVLAKKGSRQNLIRYYAVRSEQGEYLGTLEVTEEISAIIEQATAGEN